MTKLLNARILVAVAMIIFVGAVTASATGAFFSDTETSTGNTFAAGAIDLKVDSTAHYAGLVCTAGVWVQDTVYGPNPTSRPDLLGDPCGGTWEMKDLGPGVDKFFNLEDVKPGDQGENTVSLHIDNNPAWACVDITNIHNDDNSCTEPEADGSVPDLECNTPNTVLGPNGLGELAQSMQWVIWNDNGASTHTGNNVLDADEVVLTQGTGPLNNTTYTLADGGTGTPITPNGTSYLGVAYCVGSFGTVIPGQPLVCDGSAVGNEAQTDSYTADISFRVEQSRNNSAFRCVPQISQLPIQGDNV